MPRDCDHDVAERDEKRYYFIVGLLHDPRDDDLKTQFINVEQAELRAAILARADDKAIIAIWDQDSDVEYVFTGGMRFIPV